MRTHTGNKPSVIDHMLDNVTEHDEIEERLAKGQIHTIAADAEASAGFAQRLERDVYSNMRLYRHTLDKAAVVAADIQQRAVRVGSAKKVLKNEPTIVTGEMHCVSHSRL